MGRSQTQHAPCAVTGRRMPAMEMGAFQMNYRAMGLAARLLAGTALGVSVGFSAWAAEPAATPQPAETAAADTGSYGDVEEMLVTAQKRTERNLDVPINITAYSGDFLEKMGITEFSALSAYTPGLIVQEQSPNNPGFVIRGLTSDDGSSNTEARVSIYQDGVSISRSRGSVVELFDMERVEVLKGPQSTLFGRGALIGAINLVENKAEDDTYAKATVGFGNYNQREATAVVNAPIVEGKIFGRIAATIKQRDGYVANELPGGGESDLNGKDTKAIRGSFHFDASADTNFDLILNYQKDTPSGTSFKSGAIPAYKGDTSPYSYASLSADPRFEDGALGIDRSVWGATVLEKIGLTDSLSISGTSAYRRFMSKEVFDSDGSAFMLMEAAEQARGTQASQELRLNYEQGKVKSFIGADFSYEDGSYRVPLATNEQQLALWLGKINFDPTLNGYWNLLNGFYPGLTTAFNNGDPTALPAGALALLGSLGGISDYYSEEYTNSATTRSVDLFGDLSVEVVKDLTLTGGLRWSHDDKTVGYEGHSTGAASSLTGSTLVAGNTPYQSQSGDFSGFTWRLVAKYAIDDNANVYASYARGRRPQVITPVVSTFPGTFYGFKELKDETVDSYEVGAKTRLFDKRLDLEGSLFTYKYKNYQVVSTTTLTPTVLNVGSATSYGGEIQATVNATEWLKFYATYGYNHGRFDDDAMKGYANNHFRLSPDQTLSLAAQTTAPLFGGEAFFTPSYTWKSKVWFEEKNQPEYTQDAFGLLNLRTGWITPNKAWTFTFFVNNILDKDYVIDAGNSGDALGSGTYIAGAPRMLGMTTSVQF